MASAVAQTGKLVYRFDEGDASMADLLGGKGSNLCELIRVYPHCAPWLCSGHHLWE